mmetsp:Transcript_80768/g.214422  ORF Transcript_80768/g.214422 Transcript_80768/m.214422 type:complete len:244 (-) Transcript_80768:643-1374(-)
METGIGRQRLVHQVEGEELLAFLVLLTDHCPVPARLLVEVQHEARAVPDLHVVVRGAVELAEIVDKLGQEVQAAEVDCRVEVLPEVGQELGRVAGLEAVPLVPGGDVQRVSDDVGVLLEGRRIQPGSPVWNEGVVREPPPEGRHIVQRPSWHHNARHGQECGGIDALHDHLVHAGNLLPVGDFRHGRWVLGEPLLGGEAQVPMERTAVVDGLRRQILQLGLRCAHRLVGCHLPLEVAAMLHQD